MGIVEVRFQALQFFREARLCADDKTHKSMTEKGLRLASLADQQEAWLDSTRDRIWVVGQALNEKRSPANAL